MTLEDQFAAHLARDPQVHPSAYVAPGATLLGNVRLGPFASVWPGTVLRGDINSIEVGEGTNIQDGTIVHLADDFGVRIGAYVTIGHAAMIHACTIEDECLVGMQATILDGAVIGHHSIVGAHSLVTQGMVIPPGSMVVGVPAKVVKTLPPEKQAGLRCWAEKYIHVAAAHRRRYSGQEFPRPA
jgi:carbonic anhydrase/acetyltransferase-like protein (isoleucine patch superfamily)